MSPCTAHILQNDIMKAALSSNPSVVVLASEEDDAAIPCSSSSSGGGYAVVFDPLDGSRNIDAAIPTGAWPHITAAS